MSLLDGSLLKINDQKINPKKQNIIQKTRKSIQKLKFSAEQRILIKRKLDRIARNS